MKILVGAILLSDRDYILRMLKPVVSVCLFSKHLSGANK
ncbi:Hypothetical protein OINT_2001196 [Brucella intermedia LMG 3301]|uniref:Uncharacterized protein n=2 Tax=Brucella intermedia TaxID=94625 RepID=U4V5A5_9HYPH|nr:Hypothetical protein OINT_2001196 [Brucella intermedia LMG 3301]ERM01185.1 hypothetical protein Q644_22945 [Brucella intermedia 229E]